MELNLSIKQRARNGFTGKVQIELHLAYHLKSQEIKSLDEYIGARVTLMAYLGTARLPLQVDIGIGDAVVPPAEEVT